MKILSAGAADVKFGLSAVYDMISVAGAADVTVGSV